MSIVTAEDDSVDWRPQSKAGGRGDDSGIKNFAAGRRGLPREIHRRLASSGLLEPASAIRVSTRSVSSFFRSFPCPRAEFLFSSAPAAAIDVVGKLQCAILNPRCLERMRDITGYAPVLLFLSPVAKWQLRRCSGGIPATPRR